MAGAGRRRRAGREATKVRSTLTPADVNNGLAWFVLSFAIFNSYMMFWVRVNLAVFGVFLTLEITEILLTIGFFRVAHGDSMWMLHAGAGPESSPPPWPGTPRLRE